MKNNCDVVITSNQNEQLAINEGLRLLKADNLFNENDVVVIVANWVNDKKTNPSQAVVVGTESLRTIIKFVKSAHPKRIVVATGSGGADTNKVMKEVGYDAIIRDEKVDFIDFNKGPYHELEINHDIIKSLKVNTIIKEMTKLISFTQLKVHEEATMSASIKNIALSIPSTEEHGMPKKKLGIHDDLHGFIAKMALNIPVSLAIVSASPAMIGTGPTNGLSRHTGLVIMGNNTLSTDVVCARLLGFKVQGVNYLYQLEKENIGETDVKKINFKGISLEQAEYIFSIKAYGQPFQVDKK